MNSEQPLQQDIQWGRQLNTTFCHSKKKPENRHDSPALSVTADFR